MNFHIGQRVVFIDDVSNHVGGYGDEIKPVRGIVYTIRSMKMCRGNMLGEEMLGLHLVEIKNQRREYETGYCECYFAAESFRPVKETNIDIFTAMCAPKPKQKVFIIGTGILQIERDGKWIDIDQVEGFQ